jgi:hypothetical protein
MKGKGVQMKSSDLSPPTCHMSHRHVYTVCVDQNEGETIRRILLDKQHLAAVGDPAVLIPPYMCMGAAL